MKEIDKMGAEVAVFSGIVESCETVFNVFRDAGILRLDVKKPSYFNDLSVGDSVGVDGVCLTVEAFTDASMRFAVAAETLHLTGWTVENLNGRRVNLERSLRFGDRVHGHLVTGHVEARVAVTARQVVEGSVILKLKIPPDMRSVIWPKGSVCLNGVSLTVNTCEPGELSVCLIPETLKTTNLGEVEVGETLHLEGDYLAKAVQQQVKNRMEWDDNPHRYQGDRHQGHRPSDRGAL